MLLTSYFSNAKNFPEGRQTVSISRFTPKWFKADLEAKELAPSIELLSGYKNGSIDDSGYEERYKKETLSMLDPKEIYHKYKNSVLLCFEKSEDFCHRNIVSSWLNENGYKSEELKKEVRIAVIGSRDFDDYPLLEMLLGQLCSNYGKVTIVSGGARGADSLAQKFAKEKGVDLDIYPADWDKNGKAAGFIRNKDIWDNSDIGLAFWDGSSKGTEHSFKLAKNQKKDLFVFNYTFKTWTILKGEDP